MSWENNKNINFKHCPSPNYNTRPDNTLIDTIIIHYTDFKTIDESIECLTNPATEVSAHFLIDRDGSIYQLVHPKFRAWHAGVSHWCGTDNLNHNSIGIELQNEGKKYFDIHNAWEPYPSEQMYALGSLIHALQEYYPIKDDLILGHNQIAPTRKIDPGPHFSWDMLKKILNNFRSKTCSI